MQNFREAMHGWSRRRKISVGAWCLAVVAVIVLASVSSGSSSPATASPQQPAAHPFTLHVVGQAGLQVSLGQYRDQPVMVNFFASTCEPCQRETPLLASFYRSHGGKVHVIGVDVSDNTSSALRFMHKSGVSYPVGADPTAATAGGYNVVAIPQTFFLNAQHRVVKRIFGPLTQADLNTGLTEMG